MQLHTINRQNSVNNVDSGELYRGKCIMKIIGRRREKDNLMHCLFSKKPEFVVVYGRRRVGKTFLVREFFNKQFSFYATGLTDEKTKGQLRAFNESLITYGSKYNNLPQNWFEAFSRLRELLDSENVYRESVNNKRVVFLDELPWMDTARSDFKSALDYFWNSFGSSMDDLLLIVCGSATSWIINNIISDHGGFYNRITKQIHLHPFTIDECDELLKLNHMELSRRKVAMCYMIFGGIPYYINLLDNRLSLDQNVDELIFNPDGELHYEYDRLFKSLFSKATLHMKIIETLSSKSIGLTRNDLIKYLDSKSGNGISTALLELEQCGFIRKYQNFTTSKQNYIYQIIDPFTLFCIHYIRKNKVNSWINILNTPSYNSWSGNAFEILCLNHIGKIKEMLGISGVESNEYAWRSKESNPGAQIDLIIERRDDVINLCEMKFSDDEFIIDKKYHQELINKMTAFKNETKTKKAVHITMITINGVKKNEYSDVVINQVCL